MRVYIVIRKNEICLPIEEPNEDTHQLSAECLSRMPINCRFSKDLKEARKIPGLLHAEPREEVRHDQSASRLLIASLTCAGLALPLLFCMTWPTKNPSNFSFPALNSAA